jgi:hypothetical protein
MIQAPKLEQGGLKEVSGGIDGTIPDGCGDNVAQNRALHDPPEFLSRLQIYIYTAAVGDRTRTSPSCSLCVLNSQSKKGSVGYKKGTPDLYLQYSDRSFSLLIIRPRFVGLVARPRAATLHSKAGGRCAPRLGDCGARAGGTRSAGYAGRSRAALPPTKRGRRTHHTSGKKLPRTPNHAGVEVTADWLFAGRPIGGEGKSGAPYCTDVVIDLHRFKAHLLLLT